MHTSSKKTHIKLRVAGDISGESHHSADDDETFVCRDPSGLLSVTSRPPDSPSPVQFREGGANSAGVTAQSQESRAEVIGHAHVGVSVYDGQGELPWTQTEDHAMKTAAKPSTDHQNTSFNRFRHEMLHHIINTYKVYLLTSFST